MKKFIAVTLIAFAPSFRTLCSVNPLSKVIVTSDKAICKKNPTNPKEFIFTYQQNVNVSFADGSKVTSTELEIAIDSTNDSLTKKTLDSKTATKPQLKDAQSHFKKITFKGDVFLTNLNRCAKSNEAEINLKNNLCTLRGNVKIWQNKIIPKDIPASIESTEAILNFKTEEISFSGNTKQPVSTTINLEGHPSLQSKKKGSGKKNKSSKLHE